MFSALVGGFRLEPWLCQGIFVFVKVQRPYHFIFVALKKV